MSPEMEQRLAEHEEERPQRIRHWLEHAVLFAYHRVELSEGQASAVLGVDRIEFRDKYILWKRTGVQ
jgi:hypothetical protein